MSGQGGTPPRIGWFRRVVYALLLAAAMVTAACTRRGWDESSRSSAGLAPDPAEHDDAVVMAFRAKVWGLRGLVADHTWVATKERGAASYQVYEVIGWRLRRGQSVVRIAEDIPDRKWFGAEPIVMVDKRGPAARGLVAKVDAAARAYPYPHEYTAFPGPNSNTFTAWVADQVPELGLELPVRAIGRNYN